MTNDYDTGEHPEWTLADEWDDCPRADRMLSMLEKHGGYDQRLLRLYACDVVERALDRYGGDVDPRSREAIAVGRRYANGEATADELLIAKDAARAAESDAWDVKDAAVALPAATYEAAIGARHAAGAAIGVVSWDNMASWAAREAVWHAWAAAWAAEDYRSTAMPVARTAERQWQADHLREVYPNPWREDPDARSDESGAKSLCPVCKDGILEPDAKCTECGWFPPRNSDGQPDASKKPEPKPKPKPEPEPVVSRTATFHC